VGILVWMDGKQQYCLLTALIGAGAAGGRLGDATAGLPGWRSPETAA